MTQPAELVARAKELGEGVRPVTVERTLRCGACGHISVAHWNARDSQREAGLPPGVRRCQMCWEGCPAQAVSQRGYTGLQRERVMRAKGEG
jgi:heterodisulfide reductase subunit A-like polyferredoxin